MSIKVTSQVSREEWGQAAYKMVSGRSQPGISWLDVDPYLLTRQKLQEFCL